LDAKQAAAYMGVSLDYVRRRIRHEVPVVQMAPYGPLRFYARDLDRWLAAHTSQPRQ
jgi:hypothetical protein